MTIDTQDEGGGTMPELLLNVGEGLTCLDQQTREGVAQGMRLAVTEILATKNPGPDVP
jgi:hypothetical protein